MAVTITQDPGDYNLVFGHNAVTLTGATSTEKYVLQVWNETITNKLADLRQTPNLEGKGIFDIQNILQTLVLGSRPDLETVEEFSTSENENIRYFIRYGRESASGTVSIDGTSPAYEGLLGRKEYFEIDWNFEEYQTLVSGDDSIPVRTVINGLGDTLTDLPKYQASQFAGGRPFASGTPIHQMNLTRDDWMTTSWLNEFRIGSTPPDNRVVGIAGVKVWEYSGMQPVDDYVIENTTGSGGGPDQNLGDGNAISGKFSAVSFGSGPKNRQGDAGQGVTHYYVAPVAFDPGAVGNVTSGPTHVPIRVDIVEPNCMDYDHLQFSWTNSYGFRDYFSFTKKHEKKVGIQRNNFLQESADYNSSSFVVNTWNRGYKTFSQKLEKLITASTDYISDDMAIYLENLFISPDVRVKIDGVWKPVNITSSSYVEKNYRKDKLFQYEIQFKEAHNIKSQRG